LHAFIRQVRRHLQQRKVEKNAAEGTNADLSERKAFTGIVNEQQREQNGLGPAEAPGPPCIREGDCWPALSRI